MSLPEKAQVLMFLTILPYNMRAMESLFKGEPKKITVKNEEEKIQEKHRDLTLETITNYSHEFENEEEQIKVLVDIINTIHFSQFKIFCNNKE